MIKVESNLVLSAEDSIDMKTHEVYIKSEPEVSF